MLLRVKDTVSNFTGFENARTRFEFLVVSNDHRVLQTVAESIHNLEGRPHCIPNVVTARDYLAWRKVDGIVVDMRLRGALELIGRVRGGSPNRFSVVFACVPCAAESQFAIQAGANFILRSPLVASEIASIFATAASLMVADKRRHFRYPLMVPVELKAKDRQVESTMSNLGGGGMALWSLYNHEPGSPVQFVFEIPFGGPIRGDGTIAWTKADGRVGVKFHELEGEAGNRLSAWIGRRETGGGA